MLRCSRPHRPCRRRARPWWPGQLQLSNNIAIELKTRLSSGRTRTSTAAGLERPSRPKAANQRTKGQNEPQLVRSPTVLSAAAFVMRR